MITCFFFFIIIYCHIQSMCLSWFYVSPSVLMIHLPLNLTSRDRRMRVGGSRTLLFGCGQTLKSWRVRGRCGWDETVDQSRAGCPFDCGKGRKSLTLFLNWTNWRMISVPWASCKNCLYKQNLLFVVKEKMLHSPIFAKFLIFSQVWKHFKSAPDLT